MITHRIEMKWSTRGGLTLKGEETEKAFCLWPCPNASERANGGKDEMRPDLQGLAAPSDSTRMREKEASEPDLSQWKAKMYMGGYKNRATGEDFLP